MLDPNMAYQLGKIRQQELIELGQQSARPRGMRRPLRLMALLTLLIRALGR